MTQSYSLVTRWSALDLQERLSTLRGVRIEWIHYRVDRDMGVTEDLVEDFYSGRGIGVRLNVIH